MRRLFQQIKKGKRDAWKQFKGKENRQKARPSFSNAAQSAAVAAQMRFAKKLDNSLEVERPQDIVEKEKQVLNSDS